MKLVLFAVGIVLLGHLSSAQVEKMEFGLFVRPRCGPCHDFVTESLYPNFNRFAKYIDLSIMPLEKGTDVDAQYLACVTVETLLNDTLQVDYFNCHFGGMGMKECAEKTGIDWNAVETCKEDGTGHKTAGLYGEYARHLGVKHVPSIVIDDVCDEVVTEYLYIDFVKTLCNILDNPADACEDVKKIQYSEI